MRVLVVGTGKLAMFRTTALAADPRVTWVGLASSSHERAAQAACQVGAPAGGTLEEMVQTAPDAVIISSASGAHASHLATCLKLGVPVLCEKPIALTLEESEAAVHAAEHAGVKLQVGFQRRFDAGFVDAQRRVLSGELGELYSIRLVSHDRRPPPENSLVGKGSIFRDLHVHDFDLARWLTSEEVEEIYALGANRTDYGYLAESDDADTTAILLRMTNGVIVLVSGSRHNPAGHDVRAELFGSHGSVAVGLDKRIALTPVGPRPLATHDASPYTDFLDRFRDAFRAETRAFLDMVAGDRDNPCPGKEAVEALRVALAAEESNRDRAPVRLTGNKV